MVSGLWFLTVLGFAALYPTYKLEFVFVIVVVVVIVVEFTVNTASITNTMTMRFGERLIRPSSLFPRQPSHPLPLTTHRQPITDHRP
jgi:hypothetical protein